MQCKRSQQCLEVVDESLPVNVINIHEVGCIQIQGAAMAQ